MTYDTGKVLPEAYWSCPCGIHEKVEGETPLLAMSAAYAAMEAHLKANPDHNVPVDPPR